MIRVILILCTSQISKMHIIRKNEESILLYKLAFEKLIKIFSRNSVWHDIIRIIFITNVVVVCKKYIFKIKSTPLSFSHNIYAIFGPYQVGGGRNGCPVHVPYRTICNWWSHFEEFGEPPAITPLFMLLRFLLPWPFVVFFALFYFGMDDNCGDGLHLLPCGLILKLVLVTPKSISFVIP